MKLCCSLAHTTIAGTEQNRREKWWHNWPLWTWKIIRYLLASMFVIIVNWIKLQLITDLCNSRDGNFGIVMLFYGNDHLLFVLSTDARLCLLRIPLPGLASLHHQAIVSVNENSQGPYWLTFDSVWKIYGKASHHLWRRIICIVASILFLNSTKHADLIQPSNVTMDPTRWVQTANQRVLI